MKRDLYGKIVSGLNFCVAVNDFHLVAYPRRPKAPPPPLKSGAANVEA